MKHFPAGQEVCHLPMSDGILVIFEGQVDVFLIAVVVIFKLYHRQLEFYGIVFVQNPIDRACDLIVMVQHIFVQGA